jgi:probable DNA metabolism protein
MMSPAPDSTRLTYIYDGTFHGLMTIAHDSARRGIIPHDITASDPERPLLFHDYIRVATDVHKAEAVIRAIKTRLPSLAYRRVLFCFLSEAATAPKCIIDYLSLGWRYGAMLDHHVTHEAVRPLHFLAEKVERERRRMLGLVRFRLAPGGIYYAPIEPDNNILPLLSPHFAERMATESWIIHDIGRKIASRCSEGEWDIVNFKLTASIEYGEEELAYQKLWNGYFTSIAIGDRKNVKLQKQFLPRRYWKHLVEDIPGQADTHPQGKPCRNIPTSPST